MKTKDWLLAGFEAIVWYVFIYYFIYTIKNPVNLYVSALVLIILAYLGAITCPWFRKTKAFKELVKR